MWFDKLTTLRKLEGRIIGFIDQRGVGKKILQNIGLWEESHAPPERDPPACSELVEPIKEITFDPSYGSTVRVPHGPEEDRRVNSRRYIRALTPVLFAFAHGARSLRGRTLPAAAEPCLHVRPFREIDHQRTVKRRGDVEIAD